jgi:SNF2 family DNA or RNA helicase
MANHIIFVAPYLTSGSSAQQLYDAARTQAKGRAYRFGQKKDVLVYDFVTEHTIDVDIIEYRSGQLIKEYEEGTDPAEVKIGHRLEDAQDDESSIFGSRLAHKIFSNDEED